MTTTFHLEVVPVDDPESTWNHYVHMRNPEGIGGLFAYPMVDDKDRNEIDEMLRTFHDWVTHHPSLDENEDYEVAVRRDESTVQFYRRPELWYSDDTSTEEETKTK